jgi:hypothetical protein
MKPTNVPPVSDEIASLLASERVIGAESGELRQRALLRAQVAQAKHSVRPAALGLARWRWLGVAAALAVATLAAAVESRHRTAAPALPVGSAQSAHPTAELPAPQAAPREQPAESAESADSPTVASAAAPRPALTRAQGYALELKLLQPARAALNRGDDATALAAIAEHERRFPDGQLSEEREGLRVFALLGAQRTGEACRAATAFRRRFSHSMLLSRMNVACGAVP